MDRKAKRRSVSSRNSKSVIADAVIEILQRNAQDLDLFYEKPGGWEGWLQTELYRNLRNSQGMVPTAEVHSYAKTALRTDFGMIGTDGDVAIELKVESFWQEKTFKGQVEKDIQKVQEFGDSGILLIVARSTAGDISESFRQISMVGQVGKYFVLRYLPGGFFDGGL
jgi:hypothetical protein